MTAPDPTAMASPINPLDAPIEAMEVIDGLQTIIGEQAREIAILRIRLSKIPREITLSHPSNNPSIA